jgi:Sec-independent protein translocase protein TatA
MIGLGLVVLGPKQLQSLLQHAARAKVEWEKTRSGLKSQLMAELEDDACCECEDPNAHSEHGSLDA